MKAYTLAKRSLKWKFQNPATLIMSLIQPLIWLLLFTQMFQDIQRDGYSAYVLAGVLVMNILNSAGMSGIANYSLKSNGSYYRIYISPVKRSTILFGHIIEACITTMLELLVLFLISFLLGVRIESGLFGCLFILLILIFCISTFASLSYALSFIFSDENPFIAIVNTLILPLFFISSALMPLEAMPTLFHTLAKCNPLTYIIDVLRTLILESTIPYNQISITLSIVLLVNVCSFYIALQTLKHDSCR